MSHRILARLFATSLCVATFVLLVPACGDTAEADTDTVTSSGGALELCDQQDILLRSSEAPQSFALRRATRIAVPTILPISSVARGRAAIVVEADDGNIRTLCYAASDDAPELRYLHFTEGAADCSAPAGTSADSPPTEIGATAVRVELHAAQGDSFELRWAPDALDCSEQTSGAGRSGDASQRAASRGRGVPNAGGPKPPGLANRPDVQAVTETETATATESATATSSEGGSAGGDGDEGGEAGGGTGGGGCGAPDPGTVAPELDLTVTTSLYEAVRFLYEDSPPVQTGVVPGTIVPARTSLVQGTVLDPDDMPLACAEVTVWGHPEYGSTTTRADGRFDLVVNGGGSLVLSIESAGLITAHRRWTPAWNESAQMAPVKLIEVDSYDTPIDFTETQDAQYHLATAVTDDDGDRQAVLLFQPGTDATMVMPNESTEPVDELTVRATEFTTGANGLAAMPAELPAGTQYTYAIEFTADEAEAAGATTVLFDPPAALYVENFLDVPVGTVVPAGSYDRDEARWSTEPNGRVIEILDIVGGVPEIDIAGLGVAATALELAAFGITEAELELLASLYPITPQQLTRTPVMHFTQPLDCNFPGRPPEDAIEPPEDGVDPNEGEDCTSKRSGSIIECESQVLGQSLAVPGTPFSLNYRSSRVPGSPSRHLRVNVAGEEVPASLLRARLEVSVADRTFEETFENVAPNDTFDFGWDGLDAYGRVMQGAQPARVCLTYDYPATYVGTDEAVDDEIFGDWGQEGVAVAGRSNTEIGLSRCYSRGPYAGGANVGTINKSNMLRVGELDARTSAAGLGGWTLSVHHTLGLETGTLYYGNGEKRDLANSVPVAVRVAGNGSASGLSYTGPSAIGVRVSYPTAIAVGADGSLYVATAGNGVYGQGSGARVRRVTTDGAIEAFAGTGVGGFSGDGGAAIDARFSTFISALAVAADGSLYIADTNNNRIRMVGSDGVIETIAGSGAPGCDDTGAESGGGDATDVKMGAVQDIELASDGELWIVQPCRVRRLSGGKIMYVAGRSPLPAWQPQPPTFPVLSYDPGANNSPSHIFNYFGTPAGDSIPPFAEIAAKWAQLTGPHAIVQGRGAMYLAEGFSNHSQQQRRIRRIPGNAKGVTTFRQAYELEKVNNIWPCNSGGGCAWNVLDDNIGVSDRGPEDVAAALDSKLFYLTYHLHETGNRWRVNLAPANRTKGIRAVLGGGSYLTGGAPEPSNPLNGDDVMVAAQNYWMVNPSGGGGVLTTGPDGTLYVADHGGHKVVKLTNGSPGMYGPATIPSEDGSELYEFDDTGRHLRTRNGWTHETIWTFDYDGDGRLESVTDAFGDQTTIQRDGSGNPTAIVSADGVATALHLDANGYVDELEYPSGETHEFVSDANGMMQSMTTPRGLVHEFEYDGVGRLIRDDDPEGGFQTLARSDAEDRDYDVQHATSLDIQTRYAVSRSETGERTRTQTHPDGTVTTIQESDSGTVTTTAADGTTTTMVTSDDRRLGMLARVPWRTTTSTPGGRDRIVGVTRGFIQGDGPDPLEAAAVVETVELQDDPARRTITEYTAAAGGNPATILERSGESRATLAVLGVGGRVDRLRVGTWSGTAFTPSTFEDVVYGYDVRGRLETVTQGTGASERVTVLGYDDDGFVDAITDAAVGTFGLARDPDGRPTSLTLPDAEVIALRYDDDGNLEGITPPDRSEHTLAHDGVDQVERYTPPDVVAGDDFTDYLYDSDHALTDILRPDGKIVTFGYDAAGRLDAAAADGGDRAFAYWATGQPRSFSEESGGTTEFSWDGPLLLGVERSGTFVGEVTWAYGEDFSLTSETVVGASTIAYAYDDDDLLTSAGGETITRHAVTGAVAGTALADVTSVVTYSTFGELATLGYAYDGTNVYAASYVSRDPLGRITEKSETIGGVTSVLEYEYDAGGRLHRVLRNSVEIAEALYDGNGNRVSLETSGGTSIATYDAQDRLEEDGDFEYAYNEAGELASRTETATSDVTTYAYHELGGLLQVDLPGGVEVSYVLDGAQRRIGKRVDGVVERGWLYGAQIGPVAELDATGAIEARFVYGTRDHVPDFMEKDGERYRLVSDDLGSVRLVVDVATGAIAQRIDYDPWGVVTQDTSPGFQPFGYAGGLYDTDTGLVRFGARDYDPVAARWTTKDPIGFGGGVTNLYSYVAGDPINAIDPAGLISTLTGCAQQPLVCAAAGLGPGVALGVQRAAPVFGRLTSQVAAACQRAAPRLLALTKGNFRENLARLTGGIPKGAQAHHAFPKAMAREFWNRFGINVHDPRFGAWWDGARHNAASTAYNRQWQNFLMTNPSKEQAMAFARALAKQYGYEVGF
jgi:RHS repeat-associated protein